MVKNNRQMGMANKTVGCVKMLEVLGCVMQIEQVFPNRLPGAAMRQRDVVLEAGIKLAGIDLFGKAAKEGEAGFGQCLFGPFDRLACLGVERVRANLVENCRVVIPDDTYQVG